MVKRWSEKLIWTFGSGELKIVERKKLTCSWRSWILVEPSSRQNLYFLSQQKSCKMSSILVIWEKIKTCNQIWKLYQNPTHLSDFFYTMNNTYHSTRLLLRSKRCCGNYSPIYHKSSVNSQIRNTYQHYNIMVTYDIRT